MKKLQDERGYTLFLALFMTVIFGVLATALLTTTMAGTQKSDFREDNTRANELASMGLDHLTEQINDDIEVLLESNADQDGIPESIFISNVHQILEGYHCENSLQLERGTGEYSTCVEDILNKQNRELPVQVQFKSTGTVDGVKKAITSVVEIGGEGMPDFMRYAVNTFVTEGCAEGNNCKPGEGNLYLHGGSMIQGDIHAARNLITSNRSYEKYAGSHWIHSYFPSVKIKEDGSIPQIVLGEDLYTFQWDNVKGTNIKGYKYADYARHVEQLNIPGNSIYKKHDFLSSNVFTGNYLPVVSDRTETPGREEIDIIGKVDSQKMDRNTPGIRTVNTSIFTEGGVTYELKNTGNKYANSDIVLRINKKYDKTFFLLGHGTYKRVATEKNLYIGRTLLTKADVEFTEGLYVGGDLTIAHNAKIKGPIYVNGDLYIKGKNIVLNSPIFVKGNVHIKHATDGDQEKSISEAAVREVNDEFVSDADDELGDGANDESEEESGDSTGDGSEEESGDGTGDGSEEESGDGTGDGSEEESGDGTGDGSGEESGDGTGDGSGEESGDGTDDGSEEELEEDDANGEVDIPGGEGKDEEIDSNIGGIQAIFAEGKIFMERTNRFKDNPAVINAFFYSKESIEMDGNESNTIVRGGLSAPRIVLNSIRGRSYAAANLFVQSNPQIVEARAYEGYKEQEKRESRLQIIYDEDVMMKYSDLFLEDRVQSIPPPKVIDIIGEEIVK